MDTLAYVKRLRAAGMPDNQAEAQAEALKEAIETQVASRIDLGEAKTELKADITSLRTELKADLASLRTEITGVEARLMRWMFTTAFAQIVLIVTLVKLL